MFWLVATTSISPTPGSIFTLSVGGYGRLMIVTSSRDVIENLLRANTSWRNGVIHDRDRASRSGRDATLMQKG
jgi:hypothetical protein